MRPEPESGRRGSKEDKADAKRKKAEAAKRKKEKLTEERRIAKEEREFWHSLKAIHRDVISRQRKAERDADKAEKYYQHHSVSGLRKTELDYYPVATEPEMQFGGAMPREITDKAKSMKAAGRIRAGPKQEIRKELGFRDKLNRAYDVLRGRQDRDVTMPKGMQNSPKKVPFRKMLEGIMRGPASGSPISNKSEFSILRDKVKMLESGNMWIARMFGMGRNIPASIGRFGTLQSAATGVLSLASKAPYIALLIAVATAVIKTYVGQYRPGGPRDVRKLFRAQDDSMIGIPNENMLAAGETLFISNPQYLQGMPKSNTNTMNLRDGISRYNLRHMGDYPW